MIPKRQVVLIVFLLLLAAALQGLFAVSLRIGGAQPSLPIVLLACAASLLGEARGAFLGLWTGLLIVSMTPDHPGSILTSTIFSGVFAGLLQRTFARDSPFVPPLVVFATTIFQQGVFVLMNPHHLRLWAFSTLGEVIYNTILALPVYMLLRRIGIGIQRETPFSPHG